MPDTVSKAVQVSNPLKQTCQAMLRDWDYRRGIITTTALKRMQANLQSDSSIQSDDSETPKKKKKITAEIPHYQEKNTRDAELSPLALRRRYLPRNGRPPAAHPPPAAAAAETQAQPPQTLNGHKTPTKNTSTPHRNRLTRFKPGFEEQTEKELAIIFHRPPRTYKEDLPFYPWLPPCPLVQFNLNYKD